jgi:SAM-dependent methyltransferase
MAEDVRLGDYPEICFGGFSQDSGGMEFYSRINALVQPDFRILDYGAGRGAQIETDPSPYGRRLKTFKGRVAHIEGCDIDPVVLENPYLDGAKLFQPEKPLPYEDNSFDLIYSNWVLEHVENPEYVTSEIIRVLKPGGYFCAMTPNKRGYISIASRIAGNARHVPLLKKIQPDRLDFDVFPTVYKMNTKGTLKALFGKYGDVVVYSNSSDPSYYFGKKWLHGAFRIMHKLTPAPFHTALYVFFRKFPV